MGLTGFNRMRRRIKAEAEAAEKKTAEKKPEKKKRAKKKPIEEE